MGEIRVKLLHICSIEASSWEIYGSRYYVYARKEALLGKNMGQVITYLVGMGVSWENMGQVITYLVGRGASWEEYGSSYYIFGR